MKLESSILTSPDLGYSLQKDIRLVKLSLLYSDKITLISPKSSMIVALMQMSTLGLKHQFDLIREVAPIIDPSFSVDKMDTALEQLKIIKSKKNKSKKELVTIGTFNSFLRKMKEEFLKFGEDVYKESEFEELIPLIESGTLDFKHYEIGGENEITDFMLNEIIEVLTTSSSKYPVFDDLISDIAHYYSIENNFEYSRQNPQEIEFGKEIILELPNIDNISIDNLLKLKDELNNELHNFKGAILNYSKDIESIPFSPESRIEIRKNYDYYIKPELALLRSQIQANRFIKIITNEVLSNTGEYITKAFIGIGLCDLFDFEKFLSIGGLLAESGYKAYKEKKEHIKRVKQHPLFFINEVSRLKS